MGSVIESWLIEKANAPGLADDYIERGETCISKIVQMVKRQSDHRIKRCFIGGSVGKSTTATTSDFDCYIFIDNIEYPFKKVLQNIGILILRNQPISGRIRVDIVIETPTVLTCNVYDHLERFKVDISIAKNYATDDALKMFPQLGLVDIQQKKTLDAIKPWPSKLVYKLNGGLSQSIVRYVRQQNDFTRGIIRLTKHWYDSLRLSQPNSRTMFEILAIHCAQQENKFPTKSILRCFMGLLNMVQRFDELDVVFRDEYKFADHQFDEAIKLPRVMDPVNPYRNYAEFFKRDTKVLLKTYASKCEDAIRLYFTVNFQCVEDIFKIQERQSQFPEWFLKRVSKSVWFIESTEVVLPMGVLVRKQDDFATLPDDYHCLVVFLKDTVNEIVDFAGSTKLETVTEEVKSLIRTSFRGAKIAAITNDPDFFHARIIYPIPQNGSILINVRF